MAKRVIKKASSSRTRTKTTKKMAPCAKSTPCKKKAVNKKTVKKTTSSYHPATGLSRTTNAAAPASYMKEFQNIEKKLNSCWNKLNRNARNKNTSAETIAKEKNELVFLLGECNYLVEQAKQANKKK